MHDVAKLIEETTQSHKNNIMQIAEFTLQNPVNYDDSMGTQQAHYGINTAKVISFLFYDEVHVQKNISGGDGLVQDICVVRGEIYPVVDIAKWLSVETVTTADAKTTDTYSMILIEINKVHFAIPVYRVQNTHRKSADELTQNNNFDKVTYTTDIEIEKRVNRKLKMFESTCFILDIEMLAEEALGVKCEKNTDMLSQLNLIDKKILVAEDSVPARTAIEQVLTNLGADFHIFQNGDELINYAADKSSDEIGLVITDIEMPVKDGFQVISEIKANKALAEVPVIVHTSMSNVALQENAKSLGADAFISKGDANDMKGIVERYLVAA